MQFLTLEELRITGFNLSTVTQTHTSGYDSTDLGFCVVSTVLDILADPAVREVWSNSCMYEHSKLAVVDKSLSTFFTHLNATIIASPDLNVFALHDSLSEPFASHHGPTLRISRRPVQTIR